MRIGRAIIIPTVLALSAAGSILVASAVPAVAAQSPNVHVQPTVFHAGTQVFYHA